MFEVLIFAAVAAALAALSSKQGEGKALQAVNSAPTEEPEVTAAKRVHAEMTARHVAKTWPNASPQAVADFQRAAGVKPTGVYDRETAKALANAGVKRVPHPANGREIKLGPPIGKTTTSPRRPSNEQLAQEMAPGIAAMLRAGKTDKRAVQEYQRLAGLKPDGIVGPLTRAKLASHGQVLPKPPVKAVGSMPSEAEAGKAWAKENASKLAAHLRTAGKAYDRSAVRRWQRAYGPPLVADGVYGPKTRAALVSLGQKDVP